MPDNRIEQDGLYGRINSLSNASRRPSSRHVP